MNSVTILNGGSLYEMYETVTNGFLHKIDPAIHVNAYRGVHELSFAETEFAGKYLYTCVHYFSYMKAAGRTEEAETAFPHAKAVVDSIIKNQRDDGYIGGLDRGNELRVFSVWNQAFTLLGMLAYYGATGDKTVLRSAERIADYNAAIFMNGADILSGGNGGSQHLSFLLPLVRLCKVSGKPLHRDFVKHIVEKIKASDNNFFDFESILELRSRKGIENFVILIGILEYGEEFGDDSALNACIRYRDELIETQIRENGNGTIREVWTEGGNKPRFLGPDVKPDENCVAVGWMEFCLALFLRTKEAKNIDAVERTLFNHMLGAYDGSGEDFAYYQPNYGRRITRTADNMYKCCRYRGFSAVSFLTDICFLGDENELITMIYTDCVYSDDYVTINEISSYPFGGEVSFTVETKRIHKRDFRIRVPAVSNSFKLLLDGEERELKMSDGYVTIPIGEELGIHSIVLKLDLKVERKRVLIDEKSYTGFSYGCILLAGEADDFADIRYDGAAPVVSCASDGANITFEARKLTLVDYASAGRNNKEFSVWIPD